MQKEWRRQSQILGVVLHRHITLLGKSGASIQGFAPSGALALGPKTFFKGNPTANYEELVARNIKV